ncbi:hypothetical protein B4U79_01342 [Dinothrombium tinctorium]|uniref:Lysosomal-associated transmembrane protein 4A-like protein n=1 Tax=Dinothrombium tinctorium TaxID=1965070 RepID=A0A3S3NZW8_9ACAR|nr:hypothetical protein B4U79_01342 [Dinothrombium tinctorium]
MNRENAYVERYAYCLCLHVKPATIFLGVINLIGFSLCGVRYLTTLGYYEAETEFRDGRNSMNAVHRSTATYLAVTTYLFCATVSAMLLYGVIKSRPAYLMPFFGIQLFDFFFSLPTFLSSLYAHTTHTDYETSNYRLLDVKRLWPNASPAVVYSTTLLLAVCLMLFKGYFLCVVWKCYRYLKIKEMMLPLAYAHPTVEVTIPAPIVSQASQQSPPDYETATKTCPPPDYESAVRAYAEYNEKPRDEQRTPTVVVDSENIGANVDSQNIEQKPTNDQSSEERKQNS